MATTIVDPVARIEGHLKVTLEIDGGVVSNAQLTGNMYRGFENFLVGQLPIDAPLITQRVCGVCPTAHAISSALAIDDAANRTVFQIECGAFVCEARVDHARLDRQCLAYVRAAIQLDVADRIPNTVTRSPDHYHAVAASGALEVVVRGVLPVNSERGSTEATVFDGRRMHPCR